MPDLPKSVDLLQPLLRALKNGVVLTNDQIRNEVARELSLTSEQLNQIHSGSRTELEYRLAWAKRFYEAIASRKVSLATPILANLRVPNGSLTSCFIVALDDNLESIFSVSALSYFHFLK